MVKQRCKRTVNLPHDDLPVERALGLYWDVETDNLQFKINQSDKLVTTQGIQSTTNSVYNPLGIGIPFLLPVKLLLQRLCKLKLDWDDDMPDSEKKKWISRLSELPSPTAFQVSRSYRPPTLKQVKHAKLHHVCDFPKTLMLSPLTFAF